jgi:membrane-bound inhibitor of C-type lysozyme
MKRNILILVAVVLFLIIWAYREWGSGRKLVIERGLAENAINSVNYDCDESKQIHAVYFNDKVELNLSDKRNLLLIQAISASGMRYTNSDQSITFLSKGNGAFLEEKDKTTFDNCVENKSEIELRKKID